MKKALIGLLVLAGLATAAVVLLNNDSARPTNEPKASSTAGQATGEQSQYVDYTEDIIAKTAGTKILFFHAPWCPQCRALESSIKAGTIPKNVTIIKVDYDSNQALRKKYRVSIQTSLVKVDDNGNLVKKYVAYDEPTLQVLIDNLL